MSVEECDISTINSPPKPEGWVYIAWLVIIFVIIVFATHALMPSFLLEDCRCKGEDDECDHCELHPMLTLFTAFILAVIFVVAMWALLHI